MMEKIGYDLESRTKKLSISYKGQEQRWTAGGFYDAVIGEMVHSRYEQFRKLLTISRFIDAHEEEKETILALTIKEGYKYVTVRQSHKCLLCPGLLADDHTTVLALTGG